MSTIENNTTNEFIGDSMVGGLMLFNHMILTILTILTEFRLSVAVKSYHQSIDDDRSHT